MEITTRIVQQVYVVTLSGDLDRQTAPTVQANVQAAIPAGANVLLDLSGVSYLSSPGLRMLLAVARYVTDHHARLALVGVHGESKAVMEITGLGRHFLMVETVAEGLYQLGGASRYAPTQEISERRENGR